MTDGYRTSQELDRLNNEIHDQTAREWEKAREERRKQRFKEYEQWAAQDAFQQAVLLLTPPEVLRDLQKKEAQEQKEKSDRLQTMADILNRALREDY